VSFLCLKVYNSDNYFCREPRLKTINFQKQKNDFHGTVVKRASPSLHRGSIEITSTVPLWEGFSKKGLKNFRIQKCKKSINKQEQK